MNSGFDKNLGFEGRKGNWPEMFQELATAVFCCYLNHPGRNREYESNIASRITAIQLCHKKGDVCFNSILLKIGNTREAIADMNSFRSDKLEK